MALLGVFGQERDGRRELEQQLRLQEKEARATQLGAEDERRRAAAVVDELSAQVADLENRLKQQQQQQQGRIGQQQWGSGYLPHQMAALVAASSSRDAGDAADGAGGADGTEEGELLTQAKAQQDQAQGVSPSKGQRISGGYDEMARELQEQRAQAQHLSKLLLKKQGSVLELQAERSALKSRLMDMQARYRCCCAKLCCCAIEYFII